MVHGACSDRADRHRDGAAQGNPRARVVKPGSITPRPPTALPLGDSDRNKNTRRNISILPTVLMKAIG
jgi:hypothetical protein